MFLFLMIPTALAGFLMWYVITKLRHRGRRSPFNEKLLRPPGHSLDVVRSDLVVDTLIYLCGVFTVPFVFYAAYFSNVLSSNPTPLLVVGSAFVVICLFKAITKFKQIIQLHQGVEAEIATGQELNLLMRDGAWVFHDIPYQYGNIDHVIISTGGVFAVETKGYSKPVSTSRKRAKPAAIEIRDGMLITPNGRTKQPVQQALVHARWLHDEIQKRYSLSVPVRAVLAFPGWRVEGAFDNDCWIINPKRGSALSYAVKQNKLEEKDVNLIASWIEDLARSVVPKSKTFDSGGNKLFESNARSKS